MSRPDRSGSEELESIVGEAGERALVRPFHGLVIETRRLVLRAPVAIDAPAIAEIADNARIAQNLTSLPHPYRTDDALAWASELADDSEQKHLICLKRSDGRRTPIGAITLDFRRGARLPTLGYWIGEPWWDRGFATEAAHAVIDYAFLHQGHERLSVSCRVTNGASRRVIEKCGFQMVAQELGHSAFFQAVVPVDRFQLDRRTWESLRRWEPLRLAKG
ncbi:GNAT family N-acetyltransferase [Chthonobacter rhizosphaerae]|uniref:GNAT family N-acetyltransferase n=1 Tax=Chthonobacter rhizosphaerae TaxID=2735553 RepID=UPI0015EFBF71|nr:GNAT family N-acetyltransferase [Chthonobacter rhizosphaerae]